MASRVRLAALSTVQDQRELGTEDLATRPCVGLIPKVDTRASLEKGVSDRTFWSRPGWASACCPKVLDSELDAHCPHRIPDQGCPHPWCVWHVLGTEPSGSVGRGECQPRPPETGSITGQRMPGFPTRPPRSSIGHWACPPQWAAPCPECSGSQGGHGSWGGQGSARGPGGRGLASEQLGGLGGAPGCCGALRPLRPYLGRERRWAEVTVTLQGRTPQMSGHASPVGSQSEALPGAAPTLEGRGHRLVTPGQVAGPREPHLSSGPSLVLSGSGASAGPLLLPSGFPLRGAASTRVTGQPSCWPRRR